MTVSKMCPVCKEDHEDGEPHNARSPVYRKAFVLKHRREPTWEDAMAHCDRQAKMNWRVKLRLRYPAYPAIDPFDASFEGTEYPSKRAIAANPRYYRRKVSVIVPPPSGLAGEFARSFTELRETHGGSTTSTLARRLSECLDLDSSSGSHLAKIRYVIESIQAGTGLSFRNIFLTCALFEVPPAAVLPAWLIQYLCTGKPCARVRDELKDAAEFFATSKK
jgi:hypothetical protein